MPAERDGDQVYEYRQFAVDERVRIRISGEDQESLRFGMERFSGCVGTVRGVHPHLGARRYTVYLDEPIMGLFGSPTDHANFAAASLEPAGPTPPGDDAG